jgi:phosphoribosylformimino-5-aminoimidazole carboxamide ribotide isomerase
MILFPAIDIIDGKAVRLAQGDYAQQTNYDADPLDAARRWVDAGARALHIVDLDGARSGVPANLLAIERIASTLDVPVQVGGGLRNESAVADVIAAGATRVILGTAAFRDVEFLDAVLAAYGDRVVVSVDARGGLLAAAGWIEQTEVPVADAIMRLNQRGVSRFVYSSIDRDGMMTGPDLEGVREVAGVVQGTFIYSGGIAELADLEALAKLRLLNLNGVIVGKAIYERKFDVGDAQALLDRLR